MSGTAFKMTDWKKLKAAFSPADFGKVLVPNLRRATAYNAQLVRKAIRQNIVDLKYSPNAKLTIVLKHSSKPLVGHDSQLFNGCTTLVVNEKTAFIGFLRQTRNGENLANIAEELHQGVAITVTPKMRALFLLLFEASEGRLDPAKLTGRAAELWQYMGGRGRILPIGKGTTTIIIHGRKFIQAVFEDPALLAKCKENWAKAVAFSIQKVAGG